VQASPPASVIELSDDESEEEQAKDQEQGGDPNGHSDPEGLDLEDGDADDQPAPEEWKVVVCHHDGGRARFPSNLRRLFHRLHQPMKIDYVGLKRTHPVTQHSGRCQCAFWRMIHRRADSTRLLFTMP
jgi:hypothetical protein